MNTIINPKTPPNRMLYATLGLLLVVLLFGAGGFLWLSNSSGGAGSLGIGGPFTLENGDGKPVTDQDFAASTCWCILAIRSVPTCVRRR